MPPAPSGEIGRFESQLWDLQARQDYRIVNLWEVDVRIVFEQPLPTLLPFVPVMQSGNNEVTIQQAVNLLRQDQDLSELENLLGFFATFVISTDLVQQILRWGMTVLRESPWYQQILREGEQRGVQQGKPMK